jgi:transcriptional regulator with XRE-family HTH domain
VHPIHEDVMSAIGEKLEMERKRQDLTLRELAARAGVSASLLCSIEKGRVNPSVATLFGVSTALGVTPHYFFDPDQGAAPAPAASGAEPRAVASGALTRAERPTLRLTDGIVWQLLTQRPDPAVEFIEVEYPAGASSGAELYTHAGREYALVLEGEATIELGFEQVRLGAGDSIAYDSTTPHRVSNHGTVTMRAIWVNHKTA